MSLGEDRVRIKLAPLDNSLVGEIKQMTAELIDLCEQAALAARVGSGDRGEVLRLWRLAQTDFENAAMWAVKAATA
jgi:hypothetical protein